MPVEKHIPRLGKGRFQTVFIPDPIQTNMFIEGSLVQAIHHLARDENRFFHWANFCRSSFRSENILSATFLKAASVLSPRASFTSVDAAAFPFTGGWAG